MANSFGGSIWGEHPPKRKEREPQTVVVDTYEAIITLKVRYKQEHQVEDVVVALAADTARYSSAEVDVSIMDISTTGKEGVSGC